MKRSFILLSIVALAAQSAKAEIVPQTGAVNQNGQVPVVNINAPNSDGVSHNRYSQFDVGSQGAILNNSVSGAHTTLAGDVAGNGNLGGRSATVILNEINSANKSMLNGMVEVAGQRADVVIANKSGITCNGCGFINAGQGVLTTGELQFKNGVFDGYRVEQGNILIDGQGMRKGDVDYTAILARTEQINAAIHANDLLVSAGKKTISSDLSKTKNVGFSLDKPAVLLDVAELGGMYAGKITLVATENGVGVNGIGTLVPVSIANQGKIQARGDMSVMADVLNNGGAMVAQEQLSVYGGTLSNRGRMEADKAAFTSVVFSNSGDIRSRSGNIALAVNSFSNNGQLQAAGDLHLSATQLNNVGLLRTEEGSMVLATSSINNAGQIAAAKGMHISAIQLSNIGDVKTENGMMTVRTTSLNNTGKIRAGGALQIDSSNVLNIFNGVIEAQNELGIQGSSIDNYGRLASLSSSVNLNSLRFNQRGEVAAFGDIRSHGLIFGNHGKMISEVGTVTHNGKVIKNAVR
ncbi:filamentous hemagglutinin N-terminal domain-containing protein [Serratia ureilytica]|uniref:filamentous hemagglutinin N-terminal domain-containing protein n=1 Tax=Serratia ureilytica TaxID=300181 RepID=UPI001C0F9081|nr:filamentous hemagglutinin N-terminal domain-containing protein [Serratia ureilytica]MBU5412578.1 filamentous hemagglutinin N-terminal domain-containing protein [Serratia ureilytica]